MPDVLTMTRGGSAARGGGKPLVVSPGDVRNYAARVESEVASLEADILAWGIRKWGPQGFASSVSFQQLDEFKRDKNFWNQFRRFRARWDELRDDIVNGVAWIASPGTSGRWDEVREYETEEIGWRQQFSFLSIPKVPEGPPGPPGYQPPPGAPPAYPGYGGLPSAPPPVAPRKPQASGPSGIAIVVLAALGFLLLRR